MLRFWRIVGLVIAVVSVAGLAWLVGNHDYDLRPEGIEVTGTQYTSRDTVLSTIGLADLSDPPSVFRLNTVAMELALLELPAIADADVEALLPDRLVVHVSERTAVFILARPDGTYVIDEDGFVLADASLDPSGLGLPVIDDSRDEFAPTVGLGERLDEISLAAVLRLAGLTPASLGTAFPQLRLSVDDTDGYVLTAEPGGWRAIFGHYTPTLRPVDLIDRQVQCLRSRIAAGEADIAVIYLAPLEERCGTYLPRSTPRPTPDASASPSPAL